VTRQLFARRQRARIIPPTIAASVPAASRVRPLLAHLNLLIIQRLWGSRAASEQCRVTRNAANVIDATNGTGASGLE
jgi:hypothetical protein